MRIAIIGFGLVGRSSLVFLKSSLGDAFITALKKKAQNARRVEFLVWDAKPFTPEQTQALELMAVRPASSDVMTLGEVLTLASFVIVSPGVDIARYGHYAYKVIREIDIFNCFIKCPVIGVTGSIGKTTVTKLIGILANQSLEKKSERFVIGGNIGTGMLDIVQKQEGIGATVLELSSFQLEGNKTWAPQVALLTNCYENHLDRHKTMQQYLDVKLNILRYQTQHQAAIVSLSLFGGTIGNQVISVLEKIKNQLYVVSTQPDDCTLLLRVPRRSFTLIAIEAGDVIFADVVNGIIKKKHIMCTLQDFSPKTFTENWLFALAALQAFHADCSGIIQRIKADKNALNFENEHRCELVRTIRGVDFYNDSKATIIQATEAAVKRLAMHGRPIILILGGLGKGVDRSPLLVFLKTIKNLKKVYSFGPEGTTFLPIATYLPTLNDVMVDLMLVTVPGDIVLFSPSGTSYDFYHNYEERGAAFKNFVARLA